MDLKKTLSKIRSTDRKMVENLADATIGAKVIEILGSGGRLSRASLMAGLRADMQSRGADLSGTAARVALESIERACASAATR